MYLLLFWSFKCFWSYNFPFFEKNSHMALNLIGICSYCVLVFLDTRQRGEEENLVDGGRTGYMEETQTASCPSEGAVLHDTPATTACNNPPSLTSNDQCVEILQGFLSSAFLVLSNQLQSWLAAWVFPQAFLSSLGCYCLGLPLPSCLPPGSDCFSAPQL